MTRKVSQRSSRSPARGKAPGSPVRFRTTLNQAAGMNATGIIVPAEVIDRLGHGKRPPVRISINGYAYRSTVGVMSGQAMIGVSAAIRKETGLRAGDTIDVELTVDETPREVDVPADFARALAAHRGVRDFFDGLANSLQRYQVDNVNAAKTDETRKRRIDKAVALFRSGRKR